MRRILLGLVMVLSACASAPRPTPGPAAPMGAPAEPTSGPRVVHVDHAWVKNAGNAAKQAARRQAMESLRQRVEGGASFTAAFGALGVDGTPWHVAEGETYDYEVIPAAARDLPAGSLSAIIPGDGGLHLFRVHGREAKP